MARRGRFGRLPRAQPSLTNTIIAIAREMQNQRDTNIMDAWKGGGLYEGKKVTDQMVLDHWEERMKHVSPDDPLYDTYKMTVNQLQYSIAESKISTLYARGKVSAKAMAHFYLNWAKKVPKNSEFHRILERNAAQFMKSLKGSGGGRGGGSRGLSKEQISQIRNEMPGAYLYNVLQQAAEDVLIVNEGEPLSKMRFGPNENDPGAMLQLIDAINARDPKFVDTVMATLHRLNPNISADEPLTVGLATRLWKHQRNNIDARAWAALGKGQVAKWKTLQKERDDVDESLRQAGGWSSGDDYFKHREDFLRVWNSDTETDSSKLAAAGTYQNELKRLMQDAINRGDKKAYTSLESEFRAASGDTTNLKPTLYENFSTSAGAAAPGSSAARESDALGTAMDVQTSVKNAADVAEGRKVITYGEYQSGVFTPKAGGGALGVIDKRYVSQDPKAWKPTASPGANGVETVFVQGVPIMGVPSVGEGLTPTDYGYVPPAEGEEPEKVAPVRVATGYDTRVGSDKVRVYGIPDGQGGEIYTLDPPWLPNAQENFDTKKFNGQDVIFVTIPPGANTPVAPWNDPLVSDRIGVTPNGHFKTIYVATAMGTPEGVSKLGTISAPEAMQWAVANYGNDFLPAYGEILAQASNIRVTGLAGEGPRGTELIESQRGRQLGGPVPRVQDTVGGNVSPADKEQDRPEDLMALMEWRDNYATAQGIAMARPAQKEDLRMPTIRLPGVNYPSMTGSTLPPRPPVVAAPVMPVVPKVNISPITAPADMPARREGPEMPKLPKAPNLDDPYWAGGGAFGGH